MENIEIRQCKYCGKELKYGYCCQGCYMDFEGADADYDNEEETEMEDE